MIKQLTLAFTLLFASHSIASYVPTSAKGQEDSATIPASNLQLRNKQVTKTGLQSVLLETGNRNLLVNPSFEHTTTETGWTTTGCANLAGSSSGFVADGLKSMRRFCSTSGTPTLTQSSTINAAALAGAQMLAMVRVKTTLLTVQVCAVIDGVVSTTLCVAVQGNDSFANVYKIPFVAGSVSSGIWIGSTSATTGSIYVDDAFVGPVDLKQDVDSSRIAGESYFAGTTGCVWPRSSSTVGPFTADADCPGPTVAYSSMGQWLTTDSDLPRQTINNLPAGTYRASFYVANYASIATTTVISINDGTTTCEGVQGESSATTQGAVTVSCVFTYNSAGNRTFELYGALVSGTINIANGSATPRTSSKFQLEYFSNSSTYSSTNADTDWAACTVTYTGLTTSLSEIQCKRQGGDLLMKGKFTSNSSSAVELRIGLPSWNGAQLVSKNTSIIPSIQKAGELIVSYNGSASLYTLIEPSVAYLTVGFQQAASAGLTKATGAGAIGSSATASFDARIPIAGWENSNVIIGSFKDTVTSIGSTNGNGTNLDIQTISFGSGTNCTTACTAGTCSICTQNGTKITSTTFVSTGNYDLNGLDGTKYRCFGAGYSNSGGTGKNVALLNDLTNSTSTKARIYFFYGGAAESVATAQVTCIGVP